MAIELIGRKNFGTAKETWLTDTNEADRSATEVFIIQGNECSGGAYDSETDIASALDALGVPNLADMSTDNPGMYCIDRTIRLQPGSENIWEVSCTFNNNPWRGKNAGGTDGGDGSATFPGGGVAVSPFAEPAQVSMTVEQVQTQSLKDYKGFAMASGSGEVLDGFTETIPVAVITIRQLEQFVSITNVMSLVGHIHNGSTPWIAPYGQYEILFSDFDATPTSVDNVSGYDCTYRFKCIQRGDTSTANYVNPGSTTLIAGGQNIGWRSIAPNYGTFRKPLAGESVFDVTATREKRRPNWWLTFAGAWAADDLSDVSYLLINTYPEANLRTSLSLRI